MRSPRLPALAAFLCVAGLAHAASFEDRVETLFRPLLAEMMALSPDGQRVAYTSPSGRELRIVILPLEPPGARRTITVELPRDAPGATPVTSAALRFLRWATAERLVYAPAERIVPLPPEVDADGRPVPNPNGPTILAPIMAADADGRQRGTLVDAKDFQETSEDARRTLADLLRTTKELQRTRPEPVRWRMPHLDILGFLPSDREQLIVGTRGAYSFPAQHLVDIRTGTVRGFGGDWTPPPGEPHVFDWFRLKVVGERQPAARPTTHWQDDDLARVQRELEQKFPRRTVEIADWSDSRARVLFRVTGGSDPGRVFLYQRPENLVLEILRRAPWLSAAALNDTRPFEFTAADGAQLSGQLTWPAKPRVEPPPLVVVFPSGPPGRAHPAFDPEAELLADQGFVVARLNHRSMAGGRNDDPSRSRAALDRPALDDAQHAIDWLAARHSSRPFDVRRVAALGHGIGGALALRARQQKPATFHCGVAIDAATDLDVRRQAHERPAAVLALDPGLAQADLAARVAAYRAIDAFLGRHLHAGVPRTGSAEETK